MEIPEKVKDYFEKHDLDPTFVKDRLGWNWNENSISIPIYDQDGMKLYDKIRNLDFELERAIDRKTWKFRFDPQGNHPSLYGVHLIKKADRVILCEGEPDCAGLWQRGIPAVTSTGGVQKFDPGMAEPLIGKKVYIFLDTDLAGQKGIKSTADALSEQGIDIRIGSLPESVKDISEYFAEGGTVGEFNILIEKAVGPNQFIISKSENKFPIFSTSELLKMELPKTKWLIDKVVRSAGITFWVGIGGVGKTSILYSVVKSVSEGIKWLGIHNTERTNILLLDKENELIDVQTSLRAMNITSSNIFYFKKARAFNFISENSELSEEAVYLKAYCEEKNIGAVIMDSMADFFQGDENSSAYASLNVSAWLDTFPDISINVIHHENKETPNYRKTASMRMRGSSHLFNAAQGVLSLSLLDENDPKKIKVEHTKVRGARRLKPFEVEMIIEPHIENPEETIISGFKYVGEIMEAKNAAERGREAILNLLAQYPDNKYYKKEITNALNGIVGIQTIKSSLLSLKNESLVNWDKVGQAYIYWHKSDKDEVENYLNNPDNFH